MLAFALALVKNHIYHKDLIIYNNKMECQTFVGDLWLNLITLENGANDEWRQLYGMEVFIASMRNANHIMMCETFSWECHLKSADGSFHTSPHERNIIKNVVVPGAVVLKRLNCN